MYYVYILQCVDGSLYTGITNDLEKRIEKHIAGTGAAYTRAKKVEKLVYSETRRNRSYAQKREAEIKSWTRAEKLAFIKDASKKR